MSECTCEICKCGTKSLIACQFCMKDTYCSEDCKQLGWAIHQDNCNIAHVPESNVTLFLDKNDTQNHIVRHVNPSGYIEQHVVIGNSSASSSFKIQEPKDDGKKYTIQISLNGEEIFSSPNELDLSENSIYPSAHGTAGKIAKSKDFKSPIGSAVVLWPGRLNVDMQEQDSGLIQVKILNPETKKPIANIAGVYNLDDISTTSTVQSKGLKNVQILKATDANENYCELTFSNNQLVDVEYHLNSLDPVASGVDAKYEIEKIKFMCDPTDVDHVNGLIMAMEDKGGSAKFPQFDIINQYRESLEAGNVSEPSPKVNGAIQAAQRELWEQISRTSIFGFGKRKLNTYRYTKEIQNMSNTQLEAEYEEQIKKAEAEREGGSVGTEFIAKADAIKILSRTRKGLFLSSDLTKRLNELKNTSKTMLKNKRRDQKMQEDALRNK